MARGWESKSVEDQMENSRQEKENQGHRDRLSLQEAEDLRRREVLVLAVARVRAQLESATDDRYREQLLSALASLEGQLSQGAG
jgi:hypothetical protein